MGILGALISMLIPDASAPAPVAVVASDATDATAEALARIAAAGDYRSLQCELSRSAALPTADWAKCQTAVKRRMAEIAAM